MSKGSELTKKKTALVTGGARGIGRAIALRLAEDGFYVFVNYNTSKKDALALAVALKKKGCECTLVRADISKEKDVKNMFDVVRKHSNSLDVLVNNAGIIATQPFENLAMSSFDKIIGTNVRGSVLVTKYAMPLLKRSKDAKVIFVISSSAFVGSSTQFSYVISKAALVGAVRALALEYAPHNVKINGVVPGYVNTDMARSVNKVMKAGIRKIPMGRIGEPREIAALVSFLVSPLNTYMTGQCIHINGGRYMA